MIESLIAAGQRYVEARLARMGVESVRLARKIFLGLFAALACMLLFTAGAFISIFDIMAQNRATGNIDLTGTLGFGLVLMVLSGYALSRLVSEKWWLEVTGVASVIRKVPRRRTPNEIPPDINRLERRIEDIVEDRVAEALDRIERQETRSGRYPRSRGRDLVH